MSKQLDKRVERILDKLGLAGKITTEDIKNVIYHERGNSEQMELVGKLIEDVESDKLAKEVVAIVMEVWNTTPHKSRGGWSPEELVQNLDLRLEDREVKFESDKTTVMELFPDKYPQELSLKSEGEREGRKVWHWEWPSRYLQTERRMRDFLDSEETYWEDAERELQKAIKEIGPIPAVVVELAVLYRSDGQDEKAREVLEAGVGMIQKLIPTEFVIGEDTIPWGYLENRPYLKLLMERAMSIEFGGKVSKSIPYYEEILRLNPSDNQGIRDVLATLYLKTNQLEKVLELGKQYPDDLMQELLMGRVLALFKLGRVEEAEQLIMRRYREVKHVAKEILQRKHLQPESYQPDRMTVGGEDEAYHYYLAQGGLWEGTKGAKEWLRGVEVR